MVWPTKEELSKLDVKQIQQAPQKYPQQTEQAARDFVFKEAEASSKEIYTIFGAKGSGKTTLALGFPNKISAVSFDRKTVLAKNNSFKGEHRIKVYDAVEFFDRDSEKVLESARKTYEYTMFILKNIAKESPDWVLIDGIEIYQKVAEFEMRRREGLRPYQGISNMNSWKIRNSILEELHKAAVDAAKCGVIYTTYTDKDEVVIDGTLVLKTTVPKYNDVIMWESDIVLYVENRFDEREKVARIMLRCDSSKIDKRIKTGTYVDITGKKAQDIINFGD